jgi:hypothetical protein
MESYIPALLAVYVSPGFENRYSYRTFVELQVSNRPWIPEMSRSVLDEHSTYINKGYDNHNDDHNSNDKVSNNGLGDKGLTLRCGVQLDCGCRWSNITRHISPRAHRHYAHPHTV